jgi:hypothetical protein
MAEEKGGADSVRLPWPPLAEDLRRLYVEEKLSASKIAKAYGLKYASEKTAESTILYHLRKKGIARRDAAAHIRKVTEKMVDEWVVRYQKGESLTQIAAESVSPVTVFNHLHKRGVQLSDKVEAQITAVTRFQKKPFGGSDEDRAYLLGLARGDLNVGRLGRAIRVKTSSTHPAMIDLVASLFAPHGPVRVYPHHSRLVGYEWTIETELDQTFRFLLDEKLRNPGTGVSKAVCLAYLAGLFDAEGSLSVAATFTPQLSIANTDEDLLDWVERFLEKIGFTPWRGRPDKNGVSRVALLRGDEVRQLLRILPIRHPEKKARRKIVMNMESPWMQRLAAWDELIVMIQADTKEFVAAAEELFKERRKIKL